MAENTVNNCKFYQEGKCFKGDKCTFKHVKIHNNQQQSQFAINNNRNNNKMENNNHFNSNNNNNNNGNHHFKGDHNNKMEKFEKKQFERNDFEGEMYKLRGKVQDGASLNRISIRVIAPVFAEFVNKQWKGDPKLEHAKCSVFYKENDKPEPVRFYFPYDENVKKQVEALLNACTQKGTFNVEDVSVNGSGYTWFSKGHVFDSESDLGKMVESALAVNSLQLVKTDFGNENEKYKLKRMYKSREATCSYKYHDWQITDKQMSAKKNPSSNASTSNNSEKMSLGDCVVCMDNVSTIGLSCGHVCLCEQCANNFNVPFSCPVGRCNVVSKTKLFF